MARTAERPAVERCVSRRRLRARGRGPLHRTPAPEDRRRPASRRNPLGPERAHAACAAAHGRSAQMIEGLPRQLASLEHALLILPIAALLGAALGVIRTIRLVMVPRSLHVILTHVLMTIVSVVVMIIV